MLDFNEVTKTMTKEEAMLETSRCLNCKIPRCRDLGCPAKIDIPSFIHALKENNVEESYRIIVMQTNLSPICSRVCDHYRQCIGNCILNARKNPIHIGPLERYVYDHHEEDLEPVKPITDKEIAVIGAGPAGISCALELVKNGIPAIVYEKETHAGGILSYGIPEYRLPKKILEEYILFTKKMGVRYVLGKKADVNDLLNDHPFVFLATGLSGYKKMGIEGEELSGVVDAGTFLKAVNMKEGYQEGNGYPLHGKTLVVGAGNVAMDCARTALRVGSESVTIVYRRSLEEAPASKEEIKEAMEEGVKFNFLHNPVTCLGNGETLGQVKCEVMELGEPDASGRRKPVGTGTYETFECDNLIVAIGQSPDKAYMDATGLELDHGYIISKDGVSTSNPRIWSGGDIVRGADTVVRSMVDGKLAAQAIIGRLS